MGKTTADDILELLKGLKGLNDSDLVPKPIVAGKGILISQPTVEKVETEEERLEKLLKPSSEEFWGIC